MDTLEVPSHFRQPPWPLHSYSIFGIAIFQKRGLEADDLPFFLGRIVYPTHAKRLYIYIDIIIIYKDIEIDIDIYI